MEQTVREIMNERYSARDEAATREQIRRMIDEGSPILDVSDYYDRALTRRLEDREFRVEFERQRALIAAEDERVRRAREAHAHLSRKRPV